MHATLPSFARRALRDPRVRPGRRIVRTQRARDRRQDSGTLPSLHRGAERDRDELHRQGRLRQPRLRRDARHARHARSAFELLQPEGIRADARAAGRPLLRHRRLDSSDRRRHHRDAACSSSRPPTRKASAAATCWPTSRAKTTKGWTVDQAMRKLRGPKGTDVGVGVRRRGYEQLIKFALTRDEVYIPTVPAYFMIDDTTGYIRMQDFGENTDRDVKHALHDLASKGMKRLLFDIRGNPGGPLDQAIKVSNEFLPKGKMIVYTRGRVAELGSGLPRDGRERVHRHPDRGAGQPQQRERGGDRHGRAPGSRSRVSGRRDDVRQGAGAVGLPHQRRRGPRADDGALLHAVGPHHSAAVGRELRRVPELHACAIRTPTSRTTRAT